MNYKEEFNILVFVGHWNLHIFSPEWVKRYLLPDGDFNVELPLNVNGSPRISTQDYRFYILGNKLNFVIRKKTQATLDKIEDLAVKISEYLPHTPTSAFGINYSLEGQTNDKIEELFSFNDIDAIEGDTYKIDNSTIRRSLLYNENQTLNFTITKYKDKSIFMEFNYHFDIQSLIEFKQFFDTGTLIDYNHSALSFLSNIYEIEIESLKI